MSRINDPTKLWMAQTALPSAAQPPTEQPKPSASLAVPLLGVLILAGLGAIGFLLIRTIRAQRREWQRQRDQAVTDLAAQAELLRTTLLSIGDAVITTDRSGRVETLNAIAESLTGWTNDDAKGRPLEDIFKIISEDTRLAIISPVTRALDQGIVLGLANHTLLIAKDGTEIPIDDSAAPIRINDEMVGCVLVFRDITERQQQNNQLQYERNRLSLALAAAELGQWDLNLMTNEANRNLRHDQIFGYESPLPEWSYETFLEHILPEDRPLVDAAFHQATEDGSTWEFECRINRADGKQRWIGAKGKLQKRKRPLGDRMFGIVADITERKRAEKEINDARTRLDSTLKMAEIGTWEYDIKNDRVHADDTLAAMFGRAPEQISRGGMADYMDAVHPGDRERVTQIIQSAIASGSIYQADYRLVRQDGGIRWVSARGRIDRDESGKAIQLPSVVVDITARKQTEDNLRQLVADFSEADRRKDEFLATLAHELRNPLAPIRNAGHVLRLAPGNQDVVRSTAEMVERQIGHLVRLVDDLLEVTRISRGKIELRPERVELAPVVTHVVEAAKALIQCMEHDVTVALPSQPIYLNADPIRLAQIIGNLLNNACKFTDKGGKISVTVGVEDGDNQRPEATVRVRDNGIGIAAEQLTRIFEMFTQVDTSLERSRDGLGIGLALAKNLVDMHGGTLEAQSDGVGLGSEFVLRLPILVDTPTPLPPDSSSTVSPPTKRTILVVDDNRDSAISLAMLLEVNGHQAHTAYDGAQAVEAAAALKPDVVLLDIGMPTMNGYEACRRIREAPGGERALLIALTGWGQEEDRQKSSDAGFDAHMVKPVDIDGLIKLLASLPESPI